MIQCNWTESACEYFNFLVLKNQYKMMVKSLIKDLINTLPEDLLQLIDKHTSYVEETLIFYSSNYQDGIDKYCLKNYLHHLHRKYDEYDEMFLYKNPELEILKNLMYHDENGSILLLDAHKKSFSYENLKELFDLALSLDADKIFRLLKDKYNILPYWDNEIISKCFQHQSPDILRIFIDDVDLLALDIFDIYLVITAMSYDPKFVEKVMRHNQRLHSDKNKIKFLVCFLEFDQGDLIVKMLDLLKCNKVVREGILFKSIKYYSEQTMLKLLQSYDDEDKFKLLVKYFEQKLLTYSDCDLNNIGVLKLCHDHQLINDNQLIKLYEILLETRKKSMNKIYDQLKLDDYLWITDKYLKHNPKLDLVEYSSTILDLNILKCFGDDSIAEHILNQSPQLPIKKYHDCHNYIGDSLYCILFQRDKIDINQQYLFKNGKIESFKLLWSKLDYKDAVRWASQILLNCCYYDCKNEFDVFLQYLDDNNIIIDYQHLMELYIGYKLLDCGDYKINRLGCGADNQAILSLKILNQRGKIKDHYRLLKLSIANKYDRITAYLTEVVYSKPRYGYI